MIRALMLAILAIAVIGSAIWVVHTRQESRRLFVELTRLTNERDDLNFEYGRLQIEQATVGDNNRIEQIARERLAMVSPAATDTVLVQRRQR